MPAQSASSGEFALGLPHNRSARLATVTGVKCLAVACARLSSLPSLALSCVSRLRTAAATWSWFGAFIMGPQNALSPEGKESASRAIKRRLALFARDAFWATDATTGIWDAFWATDATTGIFVHGLGLFCLPRLNIRPDIRLLLQWCSFWLT